MFKPGGIQQTVLKFITHFPRVFTLDFDVSTWIRSTYVFLTYVVFGCLKTSVLLLKILAVQHLFAFLYVEMKKMKQRKRQTDTKRIKYRGTSKASLTNQSHISVSNTSPTANDTMDYMTFEIGYVKNLNQFRITLQQSVKYC